VVWCAGLGVPVARPVFTTLDVRGLSRAARASQAWRGLAKPMLDEFEVAYVMERLVDAVESGWCWPGFRVMGPLSYFRTVAVMMMIMTCGMGRTLTTGSRTGSASAVGRWGSLGGSVFRVGLRWSLGMARSTTYDFGWVDGPRVDEPERADGGVGRS
jgi:hypothetical protein